MNQHLIEEIRTYWTRAHGLHDIQVIKESCPFRLCQSYQHVLDDLGDKHCYGPELYH